MAEIGMYYPAQNCSHPGSYVRCLSFDSCPVPLATARTRSAQQRTAVLQRFLAHRALLLHYKAPVACRKRAGSEGLAGDQAALQTNGRTGHALTKKANG